MSSNFFYVISQKTSTDKNIYEEEADRTLDYKEKYFPLKKSIQSLAYRPITPTEHADHMQVFEVLIGKDTIKIDDEYLFPGVRSRTKDFLNIKQFRTITDSSDTYNFEKHLHDPSELKIQKPLLLVYFGY